MRAWWERPFKHPVLPLDNVRIEAREYRDADEHDYGGPGPDGYEFDLYTDFLYDREAEAAACGPFEARVSRAVLDWLAAVGCAYEIRVRTEVTTFAVNCWQECPATRLSFSLAIWDQTAAAAYRLAFA